MEGEGEGEGEREGQVPNVSGNATSPVELEIRESAAASHSTVGNVIPMAVEAARGVNQDYGTKSHSLEAECCRCNCCSCICCVEGRVTYKATLRIWQSTVIIAVLAGVKYIWWPFSMFHFMNL